MKEEIKITITTKADTTSWEVGKSLLSAFQQQEKLHPETLYHWTDKIGDFVDVSSCEPHWAPLAQMRSGGSMSEFPIGLEWKRKKALSYHAKMKHTQKSYRGDINNGHFWFNSKIHNKIDFLNLFKEAVISLHTRLGLLHFFGKIEAQDVKMNSPKASFVNGSFEPKFMHGERSLKPLPPVPNLGWATFFGDEYADDVDHESISAAGFPVQKIGEGYLVQVTDSIHDVVNDFPMFSKRRAELKSLFRDDLFLIKDEPTVPSQPPTGNDEDGDLG